jgi:hypothetical protein
MKAISIIIVIMATASQIKSTFAQIPFQISLTGAVANPDSVTTPDSRPIVINVIANDLIATGVRVPPATPVIALTTPVIEKGNGVIFAGSVTTEGVAVGSILYTPAAGFVGVVTFDYMIPIGMCAGGGYGCLIQVIRGYAAYHSVISGSGGGRRNLRSRRNNRQLQPGRIQQGLGVLTGTVTVTVLAVATELPVFRASTQVSTATAVNLVNLSNVDPAAAAAAIRLAAGGGV